jgi:hypothetical protein
MSNLNSGKEWSDWDVEDLIGALAYGRTVAETADFLCRDENEVREKLQELGLRENGSSV